MNTSIASLVTMAFPVINAGGFVGQQVAQIASSLTDPYPDVAPSYKITVATGTVLKVVALMQEDFQMEVDSTWENFFPPTGASSVVQGINAIMQAYGVSAQMAVFSRRIWTTTTPLKMRVPLVFAARSNPVNEVLNPIKVLQAMALPGQGSSGFLIPPGPSPYYGIWGGGLNSGKPKTTMNIGTFLTFGNVIIQKVDVKFSCRMSAAPYTGIPLSAEAIIYFETYEIVTSDDLDTIYNGLGTPTRSVPANVTPLTGAMGPQGIASNYTPAGGGPTFSTPVGT